MGWVGQNRGEEKTSGSSGLSLSTKGCMLPGDWGSGNPKPYKTIGIGEPSYTDGSERIYIVSWDLVQLVGRDRSAEFHMVTTS